MTPTRRQFLAGTATVALASSLTDRAAAASPSPALPAPEASGIDHIVVVMMENRSFDHYLGWLPGAEGKQAGLVYLDRYDVAHRTYHLQTTQGCGHPDPDHSFEGGRVEYNDGACDGWLRAGENDEFAIGYYTQQDLAFYGQAAPYWTVCDHYFSAIMAETYPNRFYQHAAQTDRIHNATTISTLPTIWDRLAAAGLRGRYYYYDVPFTALWGTKYTGISAPYGDFLADCAAGDLPELAFVDPKFLDDEWGGFFDHVPPTVAPDANPAWGLRGFRTPCLVISPRARRGYVARDVYDHTSVLKAVEWRWNLAPLTPRDSAARNIAEVLDFVNPPNLSAPRWEVPRVVGAPCGTGASADYEQWYALRDLAVSSGWRLP